MGIFDIQKGGGNIKFGIIMRVQFAAIPHL